MSSTRVFIGNLSRDTRERDVERFFKGYGKIRECMLKNGFGFVEFDDKRDAEDAVYDLNGKDLCGARIVVEMSRPKGYGGGGSRGGDRSSGYRGDRGGGYGGGRDYRDDRSGGDRRYGGSERSRGSRYGPPHKTEHRLIVENLSTRVSWQDLKDFFREVAQVTFADAHRDASREGVVCFETREDLKKAVAKYDGFELQGRKIRLVADKRRSRSRSASGSRSRSRSRRSAKSKSRSDSRSRSRSSSGGRKEKKRDVEKGESNGKSHEKSKSKSKSKSRSPVRRSRSGSRSSKSRSASKESRHSKSHSRSRTPNKEAVKEVVNDKEKEMETEKEVQE